MFVVENITYNICDQRFHEFEIQKLNPDIMVIRKSLTDLVTDAKLGPDKELIVYVHIVVHNEMFGNCSFNLFVVRFLFYFTYYAFSVLSIKHFGQR